MDTAQGEASVDKFGKSVNRMARETAEAAKKAADALAGIGDKSEFGTEKIARQERSITASIKRTTTQFELLGKTASQKLEFKINTQGLDAAKFEPALQKLREMEAQAIRAGTAGAASLDKFGMSAKQTANSLRGIPAQFQDIVVSLQGGQAPMTVFLQQGSQLSGMFGGAGNAAKAFGGYVMGLINPFTLAAASVAGLGFAMASLNGKDAALLALSTQLTGTGRASVAAVGDIKTLVAELNKVSGVSKESATAILGEFAKVSGLGGEMFRSLGASVANFAAATGTDLPTAAKKLAAAFADPAKGAKDLEESLGTLTAAQILTIEKMAAMGDKSGAQVALMEALKTATQGLADQAMTPLGQATDNLSNAWDRMTGAMGKSDTLHAANRILASMIDTAATLAVKLSQLKLPDWLGKQFSGGLNGMVYSAITGGAQQGVTGTWNEGGASGSFAPSKTDLDKQVKAALDATTSYASQSGAMDKLKGTAKQAKDALKELEAQNKGTGIEAATLRDRISGINEKLAEMAKKAAGPAARTAGQSEVASIRARIAASEAYLQTLKAEGLAGKEMNEGEKLAVKIQKELEGGMKGVALANKQKALTAAQSLAAVLKESDALKESLKSKKEFEALRDKEISGQEASILKMEEKALAMEDEVRMYGMGKEAIEALSIARLQERIDILAGFEGSGEQIALIEKEIDARKRLAVATDAKTGLDAGVKAAKEAQAEWTKFYDSIYNGLTDSLYRAFERGGSFFKNFWDGIKNMFKTTVLKLAIQGVVGGVTGSLGLSGAANAASGGSSAFGMASNASSLYSGVSSMVTLGSQVVAGTMSVANALGTVAANATGSGISGLLAANGAYGTAAAGSASAMAGSATSMLGAIPGVGWAALAAVAVAAIFGGRGAKEATGGGIEGNFAGSGFSGNSFSTWKQDGGWFHSDRNGKETGNLDSATSKQFSDSYKAVQMAASGAALALGLSADAVTNYSQAISLQLGKDAAENEKAVTALFAGIGDSMAAAVAPGIVQFTKEGETAGGTLSRLALSLTTANAWLDRFGANMLQVSLAGGDAASKLADLFGGLENLNTASSAFYATYFTEAERAAQSTDDMSKALGALGLALPASKDEFRALALSMDQTTDAGRAAYATLLMLAPEFATTTDALAAMSTEAAQAVESLFAKLSDGIKSAIESVAGERVAVAAAALQINNPGTMSRDAILRGIAGTALATPGNAGLSSAQSALSQADAAVAAQAAAVAYAKTQTPSRAALDAAGSTLGAAQNATRAAQAQVDSRRTTEGGKFAGWVDQALDGGSPTFRGGDMRWGENQAVAEAKALLAARAAEQAPQAAYDAQVASYGGASAANAVQVAAAQAQLTAATAVQAAAVTAARTAQLAYIASLQDFSIDASKAASKLGTLREETLKYYDAQKQLADLMTTSAAGLRGAVSTARTGQLDPAQSLAQQQGGFATAYSMALATSGAAQAGYADKLTAALPGLSTALMDAASTREEWARATGTLFAQSEAIAQQLEANAPQDYAADSLAMLGQIDAALMVLDASSKSAEKIIAEAVTAGSENTANGLRAVIAALTGKSVPAFAAGGSFGGGLRIVGENGPELEATGPSRIFSASQTRSMLNGGGSNDEMVQELRALRQEVAGLRAEAQATAGHTSKTARLLDRAMPDGDALATRTAA